MNIFIWDRKANLIGKSSLERNRWPIGTFTRTDQESVLRFESTIHSCNSEWWYFHLEWIFKLAFWVRFYSEKFQKGNLKEESLRTDIAIFSRSSSMCPRKLYRRLRQVIACVVSLATTLVEYYSCFQVHCSHALHTPFVTCVRRMWKNIEVSQVRPLAANRGKQYGSWCIGATCNKNIVRFIT